MTQAKFQLLVEEAMNCGYPESYVHKCMMDLNMTLSDNDDEIVSEREYKTLRYFFTQRQSKKPMVLFEGKSDVDYVKLAIQYLKEDFPSYQKLDNEVDYLSFGGTGNAFSFYEDIRKMDVDRELFFILDHDNAGKEAMCKLSGRAKDSQEIVQWQSYQDPSKKIHVMFYPLTTEASHCKEFLLEDYFPISKIGEYYSSIKIEHPYKNIHINVKKFISDNYNKPTTVNGPHKILGIDKADYEGFKLLLDEMLTFIWGTNPA